ncbi:MAG: M1 family metallopeptidase [Bacteroidota bacterium]
MIKFFLSLCFSFPILLIGQGLFNKDQVYTRQDTLRGSITPERSWWDLKRYDLEVAVDIPSKQIKGSNTITYQVLSEFSTMQIDLQRPMQITKVMQEGIELKVVHEGNAHFIKLKKSQKSGESEKIVVYFEGKPRVARMAPWDGGFSWKTDANGRPFIATANQGIGASLWWPCKDHGYDEPEDGLLLAITVPNDLTAVGNGRLVKIEESDLEKTFIWEVVNPINNYGVNINIGDYTNFSEIYNGEAGELKMDYWVLSKNKRKAKRQFKDAPRTIEAFEYWFGPYPFYEDSYKLVEVPYLGMEHQSSVTYGNKYKNGYNGRGRESFDWSGTGWGLKWDYIIVHETGHEWFANSITAKDNADLWIHETFTTYSESLFVEYHFGKKAGKEYVIGTRDVIANEAPIVGDYGVNKEGSSDMYFKGNNILHTLRSIVNDDELWRRTLRSINQEFYHQTVTAPEIENFLSKSFGMDLKHFFDQYLRQPSIPTLEYKIDGSKISYRWVEVIENFSMPIDVYVDGRSKRVIPETEWKEVSGDSFTIDEDYYIDVVKS